MHFVNLNKKKYCDIVSNGVLMHMNDLELLEFIALKMLFAFICGLIIGLERRFNDPKANATLKTQILVCTGSMIFTTLPEILNLHNEIPRVIGQIITGIGFLGAVSILHHGNSYKVVGLTTAAWIWFCASMGMLIGIGHGLTAIFITFSLTIIITITKKIETKMFKSKNQSIDPNEE